MIELLGSQAAMYGNDTINTTFKGTIRFGQQRFVAEHEAVMNGVCGTIRGDVGLFIK